MPTKYKIIAGFTLLIVLLLALAFVGYRGLGTASTYFSEYDRLQRLNVILSDVNTEMVSARLRNQQSMATFSKSRADEAHTHIVSLQGLITSAEEYSSMQKTKDSLEQGMAASTQYGAYIDQIYQLNAEIMDMYNKEFQSSMQALMNSIEGVTKGALAANNDVLLISMHEFWKAMNRATVFVGRYVQSHDLELSKEAKSSLQQAEDVMTKKIFPLMTSEAGRRDRQVMANAMNAMQAAYEALYAKNVSSAELVEKSTLLARELSTILADINKLINQQSDEYGIATARANSTSQSIMLGISIFGVILGSALAVLITVSLIRTLGKMSSYAEAISRGDFKYDAKIKEKAEIGQMLNSMKSIPTVLADIVEASNYLSHRITNGHLRSNIDSSKYHGEFITLANAMNSLSNAYVHILDAIPISLMAADSNRRVIFANNTAAHTSGRDNLVGEFCGDMLGSEVCKHSDTCLGLKGLASGNICKGETTVDTADRHTDLELQIIPLTDDSGHPVGVLEIASDITQIRAQEQIMRKVANQASEISDRVAAASEELSAQVEEVSRSAEMQRDRVESTASAMVEMNSTVLEVARNAAQASEQSEETRSNADSGASLVNKVVQAINHVNAVAAQVQQNMEELGQQAENIGGVMNVISDIADQTNLLALNAAIEAARAGEAGRGFAVVADEVRKLAEKTMQATQEVGSSITAIQQSAQTNISEVRSVVDSVTEATGLANSSGESLSGILSLASNTSSVVASIATAAEEQSATSEEITKAIEEINNIVNDTTEGMIQSSAAVQELSKMTQELNRVISTLNAEGKE